MEDENTRKLITIASLYCYSDLPVDAIAWQLHMDEKEVREIIDELTKAGGLRIFVEQSDTPLEKIVTVDVVSLYGSRTLTDAAALMTEKQIGSIVVTENDVPFGIFTERDLLTNTISYSRLGIFLIMHSGLMGLINNGWTYGVAGIPLVIFGNILVIALEGFLVYIQDLRLHLYEWFTKFQEGEAKAFIPIKAESEFLDIVFQ